MLNAQTSSQDISDNLATDTRVSSYTMEPNRGTPSLITLKTSGETISLNETPTFLQSALGLGDETTFVIEATTSSNGVQVDKFQQYTNGIKVEHGVFKAISKKGIVLGFSAEYYNLPATITATPSLDEATALQKALDHVGATTYAWDYIASLGNSPEITAAYNEVFPKGELVFVDDYLTAAVDLTLAYRFNVYAAEPLSRADIYVDAASGKILLLDAIIKHADAFHTKEEIKKEIKITPKAFIGPLNSTVTKAFVGPLPYVAAKGDTRYAGNRIFDTSKDINGNWVLNGITPSGIENETFSMEGIGGIPLSVPSIYLVAEPVIDGDGTNLNPETGDNNWSSEEHRKDQFSATNPYPISNEKNNDDVALDAHWGAEVVLDYWKNIHNRSSYDDKGTKVFNYVHYGDAYDNAFWNGSAMTYGDGSYQGGTNPNGSFAPLTSMDVCAHEIGHGVCEFTADLVYANESGAMNEGFSDIWAASVESYVLTQIDNSLPYDPWGIGEQIDERDGGLAPGQDASRALRWMDDPKAAGNPDSYGGINWTDQDCDPTLANDQCGVHNNSGVLNKWYYLMVTGSGQAFTGGLNKQSADDQVNDAGNQYSVEGLGFLASEKITYLSETMLSPNAKFAEMRAVSIFVAQTLYGIGSQEEKSTTNAWHGVNVGDTYNTGEPNTITFSESNIQILGEDNLINGCDDFNTYSVVITGVDITSSSSITLSTSGSTATKGKDFDLSTQSLTFNGSESKSLAITVYDDAVIEDSETIVLSFVYNGKFLKQEFAISDNDFAPRTGSEPMDLIATETFSNPGLPTGWSEVRISDGNNVWKADGELDAAGRAYISNGLVDIASYDSNSATITVLKSALINAAATSDVTVSFDWEAGGELDAVDPSVIFDYGEFVYSLNGSDYVSLKKFAGTGPLGAITASGNYSAIINELDGKAFFLGWKWFNDTNAGSEFSFAIDNLKVSATPAGIETQKGETATTTVIVGNTIFFLSDTDKALIAKIENASADLGCVTMSLIDEGTSFRVFSNISTARPSKAFSIDVANQEATYDLTMYFTDEELSAYDSTEELIPLKVNSSNIDDANDRLENFQLNGVLTDVNEADQFKAYSGTFTGSGSVSIVQDFIYCTSTPAPWTSSDIGSVSKAGTICYIDGSFEMDASGAGIDGKSDSFYYTYQQMTGDGEIVVKVNSLENTNNNAKAAVMIRETLDATSAFAMTAIVSNPNFTGSEAHFEYRKSNSAKASGEKYVAATAPKFVRLVREGNTITSFISATNGNWELIGTSEVNFGGTVYVGFAATSNFNGASSLAEFSDVAVLQGGKASQDATKSTSANLEPGASAKPEMKQFTVFPNPTASTLNMEIYESEIKSVAVYNLLGKVIRVYNIDSASSRASIDVTELNKGLYILKLNTADGHILNTRFFKK